MVVPSTGSLLLINLCCQLRLTMLRKIPCYLPPLPYPLCLKLQLKLSHRVVPVGTTHLCMLHVRASQASASVPLPLLSGREAGSWRLIASILSGQILGSGGVVSSPEGSHRAGSSSFARLLQPFVYRHEGLGVVAASNGSLAFEPHCIQDTSS